MMAAPFSTPPGSAPMLPLPNAAPLSSPQGHSQLQQVPVITRREVDELVRSIKGNAFYNRQLSSICQVNGLKSTGVKAELQNRIIDLIQETLTSNDASRFHQVRHSIVNASSTMAKRPSPAKLNNSRVAPQVSMPGMAPYAGNPSTNGYSQPFPSLNLDGSSRVPASGLPSPALSFHTSPFYTVEHHLTAPLKCPIMSQHRNSIHVTIRLNDMPALQHCVNDPSYRVMIFCAGDTNGPQHIAFPHQAEIKVNGGDFKANLRGLKNKPGSTRPVDITNALRLKLSYTNNIEFTYALTTKVFHLLVNVCKIKSVPELVSTVSTRQIIPKASVVAEINKKAMDPDVIATSQVLSLKCPLSYMRLEVPCRGLQCTHIQCFDATSYLQLQEQGPQWLCPICNKSVPFDQLAVDEYVKDILQNTSKSLETVSIEPNGRWTTKSEEHQQEHSTNGADSFDDDDEVEISEVSVVGGRRFETPKTSTPAQNSTSGSASRNNSSAAPRGAATTSNKRPAPQVIDLTLSSDEDDEPITRAPKRQNTGANGWREPRGGLGFLSESPNGYY